MRYWVGAAKIRGIHETNPVIPQPGHVIPQGDAAGAVEGITIVTVIVVLGVRLMEAASRLAHRRQCG